MKIRPVILCGGYGTRLWPESRQNYPKQFLTLIKQKSLFEITLDRFKDKKIFSEPIIITNLKYKFYIKDTLKNFSFKTTLLLEPSSQGTAASIYMASKICHDNEILLFVPSDHLIKHYKQLNKEILKISKKLPDDKIITFGIKPEYPSTGFGYIETEKIGQKGSELLKVKGFFEKPNLYKAKIFTKQKNFFWNAGIFMCLANTFLKSISVHANDIYKSCEIVLSKTNQSTDEITFPEKEFKKIPNLSIDYAIMEKSKDILCLPLNLSWNDVGSWDNLADLSNQNIKQNNIIEIESKNNFYRTKNKAIATIGVKDTIIIDTNDAILIAKKNMTEKVKDVVNVLKKKNYSLIENNNFEIRPWGKFENLLETENVKVKKIIVNPKSRLSLQFHNYRSEHWVIIKGIAKILLDEKIIELHEKQSIDIPAGSKHYISNETDSELIFIEVQMGTYFGEDDIVRIDDPYQR